MRSHKEIAEEILGYPIGEDGCAPCPGAALHTAQSGPRDWRIWFDGEGKPHEYCFHNSCQGARDDFMSHPHGCVDCNAGTLLYVAYLQFVMDRKEEKE